MNINGIDLNLEKQKEEFIGLLRSTKREGIENLIAWLEKSDFFTAPSSTVYHNNFPGGLCAHSLNVYYAAKSFYESYKKLVRPDKDMSFGEDAIIITALLHDLCKTNFYVPTEKYAKNENDAWIKYMTYTIDEKLPLGHGPKSVFIVQNFIKLSGAEICAIMWHMGMSDIGAWISNYQKPSMQQAFEKAPLSVLIMQADFFASYCMEEKVDQKKDCIIS